MVINITGFTGTKLIKIFATMKSIKFSITICINFVGKMLIWDHFCDIMELSLNKYLGYFLIIFLFIESAIKPRPLLHANIQILLRTECNWSNWWWPECFYEPESSVTTPKSGQPKLPIHNIHQSYGSMCIHAGLDKSLKLMEELGCYKRPTSNCTIMNS